MATPDLNKIVEGADIKNGASVLYVSLGGEKALFDNSKDTENGLEPFANLLNGRFDDINYYLPLGTTS